jgi:uncharacterized protein (DUF2336 family)
MAQAMQTSGYASLAGLDAQDSSEKRRALLRQVTGTLSHATYSPEELAALDSLMQTVAEQYSAEVRMEFARLVAVTSHNFPLAGEKFALDMIEVAEPVLRKAAGLSDETLLKVVAQKSQAHLLAVTKRDAVSEKVSHALVEHGDDSVVTSLLANDGAKIALETFDMVARRAETSAQLQGPLARRKDVPPDILQGLYLKVETSLRAEILAKFEGYPTEVLEKAFARSRTRVTNAWHKMPPDYNAAVRHVEMLKKSGKLTPDMLMDLLRQGEKSLTIFHVAFAALVDVDYDVIARITGQPDLDALALLCRGAQFDPSLYVVLALSLTPGEGADPATLAGIYQSVPVTAAQRALRFWKASAGG